MKALPFFAFSAALLLGACSGSVPTAPPVDASQPAGTASAPVASTTATPTVEPSSSPRDASDSPADTWGPLAVLPPQDGMDTLRAEGTLRITDACVYLGWPPGELTLLFWHADQVTWNEEARAITFENFDGSVVTVGDGDHVVLGGSGGGSDSEAEGGISGEEFVRRMDWVAPPASSCSLDRWWGVGAVEH